ncbi:uncharacterized protein JCM6883_000209 [Sporobolomyces salmoneus]|uniref:uncharacterized protein n=1 Tax=Sporobolomyces salmoneus TaxID=183962 RepID=UPI0031759F9D
MFKLSAVALVALVASLVSGQQINTPTTGLFTCEPYLISFSGGQAPYTIRANQGGSVSEVLETIATNLNANSYTWNVNLPAGQSVTLALTDATGATVYADAVNVQAGSSTDCVGQSASSASGSATSAASSASESASSIASSASSSAGGAASSVRSAASSAQSGASSIASRATNAASSAAASATGTSGSSSLKVAGGLLTGAVGVVALFA